MKPNSHLAAPEHSRHPMHSLRETAQEDIHSFRKVRTLIADDSPLMLNTLAQILALERNFTLVGTATDGCQAIKHVFMLEPELILMNYHMPHLNGIEATRYIRQFQNPPLVIIITSDGTSKCRALAEAVGAAGLVVKGVDLHAQLRLAFQKLFQLEGRTGPFRETSICCPPPWSRLTS